MARCRTVEVEVDIDLYEFDDDDLKEELETRGYLVEEERNCFTCYSREWEELARLVASGQTREALELMQYISCGAVNATCAENHARTLNQIKAV